MTEAALLPLAVAIPLLGAALLAVAGRRLPRTGCDILATTCAGAEAACLALLWARTDGRLVTADLGGWPARLGIVLAADPIGAGLALLVAVLVLAVVVYAWRYFDEPTGEHAGAFPALILLFEAGMAGFALTGDLFNAFVFFELMGAAAYALTGYRIEDPRPLQGALTFGIVTSFAAYCSLLGIGLLYARTGELNLARLGRQLAGHHTDVLTVAAFALIATALLVKAAAVPFHFWLPDAHAVAPTPVCMLMSGAMVELGVYGIARVYWTVFSGPGGIHPQAFRTTFTAIGLLTALLGALMCWQQRHLKRLLAFSTISHVGLFLIAVALLTPDGATGTAVYVAAHGLVKAALFALTGVLLDRYGSVDEHGLHGKARDLRTVGVLFVVGALALAGMPPFGTGLGKALSEEAAGHWQPWLPAVFVAASAATGAAALRAALRIFFGAGPAPQSRPDGDETTGEGEEPEIRSPQRALPRTMTIVPAGLIGLAVLVGSLPAIPAALARGAAVFTDPDGYSAVVLTQANTPPGPVPAADWTVTGVLLGLLSAAVALALATAALHRSAADRHAAARAVRALRRLHSGHLGDYLAWLALGVAVLCVAIAAQT
ncbi:NADH-quinone oxidoreductase subunit D [Kitasatospora xanthocidica]|uniref:NADH-quinone oxidoreductase subunit D n=1 Tax=Kitasatospora xanthocidica TaxID=83382 RepID=A0A372ZM09_9ACTN|nr:MULTISPECIES: proton-conducting transporter membrane subunit [Kitasatospora]RGD56866.1 NADH-quinone oxidoreductase subunit D [Kitasatospora xanthocidica]